MPFTNRQKQDRIRILDLEVWNTFAPKVRAHEKCPDSYWCYCPYCDKGKKKDTHNLTGLVYKHSNGDGLGYKCLSCGVAQPIVFRFLGGAGARAAEEYAEKRLEIDAVGKGWYCPSPQRKKQEQAQAKRARAAQHRADYERQKRKNQAAKSFTDQAALKTAAHNPLQHPQTPERELRNQQQRNQAQG